MELKYCVGAQHFKLCIKLGFIENVTSFKDMTNEQLRKYLDKEANGLEDAVTLESLNNLVEKKVMMHMDIRNSRSRMQSLFANCHSLLSRNGVQWIMEENQ